MSHADADPAPKSKSQRKREMLELQALGASLAGLTTNQRAHLSMWPELEAAVIDAHGLERTALRRQIRYIGRLLRDGDAEGIAHALDTVRQPGRREAMRHHRLERLRDALINSDEGFNQLRDAQPELDIPRLRRLVATARRERRGAGDGGGERRLFRFLRDCGLGQ